MHEVTMRYIKATERGPAFAGEYAAALSDAEAKIVYDELTAIGFTKLVRKLWYCYERQTFRF